MDDDQIYAVTRAIYKAYADLDYQAFCKVCGFNPAYDVEYFRAFHALAELLGRFDKKRILAIVNYGLGKEK